MAPPPKRQRVFHSHDEPSNKRKMLSEMDETSNKCQKIELVDLDSEDELPSVEDIFTSRPLCRRLVKRNRSDAVSDDVSDEDVNGQIAMDIDEEPINGQESDGDSDEDQDIDVILTLKKSVAEAMKNGNRRRFGDALDQLDIEANDWSDKDNTRSFKVKLFFEILRRGYSSEILIDLLENETFKKRGIRTEIYTGIKTCIEKNLIEHGKILLRYPNIKINYEDYFLVKEAIVKKRVEFIELFQSKHVPLVVDNVRAILQGKRGFFPIIADRTCTNPNVMIP